MRPYNENKIGTIKLINCPDCEGTGKMGYDEEDEDNSQKPNCAECKGTGKIQATVVSQ